MMLFVIFALVIVVATGIPVVKKMIENKKLMKEYMDEQGLGKHEAIGKIKDTKTTNDKVIEGLFYLSLIALLGGGFYSFYLYENENSDNMRVQQQSERTMAQITTDQNQQGQNQQNQGTPVIQNNIISNPNDAQVQENVKREQARIDKMFSDSQKDTEGLLEMLKSLMIYLKKQNVIQLEMPLLIKNVRNCLKKVRNCILQNKLMLRKCWMC